MAPDPRKTRPERAEDSGPQPLADEVRALRQELSFLRQHKMFQLYQSMPRVLLFRFAAGMAVGLGTVIGATVLLSLIIWALSQIEFIPIIGEWAVRIAAEIRALTGSAQ
jgi:H+/gluconate symporter-like permease